MSLTRRKALHSLGVTLTAAALPRTILSTARATGTSRKRKNIEALSNSELAAYQHAIKIVKDRSAANPDDSTGYLYWASLHDSFDESIHSGCAHFSEKFFPWHRRYLYDFEAVLQQTDPAVTANVMIPFWDWSRAPTLGKHFPQPFEQPGSPLFDQRLVITPPPWDSANLLNLVREPDWNIFAGKPDPSNAFGTNPGAVEYGPHNTLHTNISRDMRNPSTAVQDPIFWSFHAGIDLIWSRWQRLHVSAATPQKFADPDAIIWFRDRSYAVASTANTANFFYEYDYDYSGDGPPAPSPLVATTAIISPAKRTTNLTAAIGKSGDMRMMAASNANDLTANMVVRLADVKVMNDRSYRLNLFLHPTNVKLSSLGSNDRSKYLMRTVTLWQAHHDVIVEIFIRPTPEQLANLRRGWIVTIQSEAVAGSGEPAVHAGHPSTNKLTVVTPLQATSKLVGAIELQER